MVDDAGAAPCNAPAGTISGARRLSNVLGYIFAKQEPNAPLPPPPEQLVQIAHRTLYFATIGGLAQGVMQYIYERRGVEHAGAPAGVESPARSPATIYEQRKHAFRRVSHAMLRGVLRTGALAAIYFSTELAIAIYRDEYRVDTYYNTLCGGMVAGGVLGALGQTPARAAPIMLRGGIFGTALGGMVGFPVGMMQDYLMDQLPGEERARRDLAIAQMRVIADGEMDAIRGREFVMEMELQERRERGERAGRMDIEMVIKGIQGKAGERQRKLQAGHAAKDRSDERTETRSWKFWKR